VLAACGPRCALLAAVQLSWPLPVFPAFHRIRRFERVAVSRDSAMNSEAKQSSALLRTILCFSWRGSSTSSRSGSRFGSGLVRCWLRGTSRRRGGLALLRRVASSGS